MSETGIDFIGFIFYPDSKRYVGRNPDKKLFMNVPESIKKIGVFVNEEIANVEMAQFASLKVIQLHGKESVSYCNSLKPQAC